MYFCILIPVDLRIFFVFHSMLYALITMRTSKSIGLLAKTHSRTLFFVFLLGGGYLL